jgi:hypothetical protein
MRLRTPSLILCLFMLLLTGAVSDQAPASQAAKQKVVPLALQYRQKLLQIIEAPPLISLAEVAEPAAAERHSVSADDSQDDPAIPGSIHSLMSLQL